MVNEMLKVIKCQSPNTLTSSPTNILSKTLPLKICVTNFHIGYTEFKPQTETLATNPSRYYQVLHRCHRVPVTNLLLAVSQELEFPRIVNRSHRVWKLPSATHIGTTENHISVSPRFLKLPHLEHFSATEFYFSFTEWLNNGVTVGFLEILYIPLHHLLVVREALRTIPHLPHPVF